MDNKVEDNRKKTGGRKAGVPNKVTQEAREAVKALLDANLPFLQTWLQTTADGVFDDNTGKYIVLPNPGKACDIVQNLVEYSVPKLARTEVVGDEKAPQRMVISWKK
jgi:copper(I)-binding protein